MLMRLRKRSAQSTAEYAILIALVIGAAMAMQVYVKRGLQGRLKDVVDHTGSSSEFGGNSQVFSTGQYEPYYLSSTGSTSQDTQQDTSAMTQGGGVQRDSIVETNIEEARVQTINPQQEQ